MDRILNNENFKDQLAGSIANNVNQNRIAEELNKLNIQDENFHRAIVELDKVRQFVGEPDRIIGSPATKHGEIAEQVEVGIRRARQALERQEMTATFEGVGRTAPEDYLIEGIKVQSKFYNGLSNNLDAVIHHMEKYSNFGRDGSFYHMPKDHYEIIQRIYDGEKNIEGLKLSTILKIKEKLLFIEQESGRTFNEVVKPGISSYPDVQQGKIIITLDNHEKEIISVNDQKREQIISDHQPSIEEALKVTGIAAAVGASVSITTTLYKKHKEGKKFYRGDFTNEDWKDVGVETLKGGALGGVSGAAIYGLTNYASLSAPFAASVVSATKGIASLVNDFDNGMIDKEELVELGLIICSETAIVGLATAAGQTIVPIPVLGAVIGSIAGTILAKALGAGNRITAKMIIKDLEVYLQKLDNAYKDLVNNIATEFLRLGDLTEAAFSIDNNLIALEMSVKLAREYGVDESKILKSKEDIDSFMLD